MIRIKKINSVSANTRLFYVAISGVFSYLVFNLFILNRILLNYLFSIYLDKPERHSLSVWHW